MVGKEASNMNIEIKPLSPDLIPSYIDFFDNRAFSDDSPCGPCYCTSPSMDAASEAKMVSEFGDDVKSTLRRVAINLLIAGRIHGYLAFEDDIPVGWCNAGDRDGYPNWIPEIARQASIGKTIAVLCFAIAPGYRGQGLSLAILERIIEDAKAQGYAAVEGYPRIQKDREPYDFNGPLRLFEKAGFVEKARQGELVVMSKDLRDNPPTND
jgi:GNAT superfamily N-acetyltransferase